MQDVIFSTMREFSCTYAEAVHLLLCALDGLGEWSYSLED